MEGKEGRGRRQPMELIPLGRTTLVLESVYVWNGKEKGVLYQ